MHLAVEIGTAPTWQHEIADDRVERGAGVDGGESGRYIAHRRDGVVPEESRERRQKQRIVVDDEDAERPLGRNILSARRRTHTTRLGSRVEPVKQFALCVAVECE